jgi:hypothetical protein
MRSSLYVVLGVLVITAVAIAMTILREKRRARQMVDLALTLGCSYTADGRALLAEGLAALPVFVIAQLDGQSEIRNVLRKHVSGAELSICDYHYWTGGTGKDRFDHYQTVACYKLGQQTLPDFTLHRRPSPRERNLLGAGLSLARLPALMGSSSFRSAVDVMANALEDDGIQFPSHPDFPEHYLLRSRQRADETRALFTGELIEFLQRQAVPLCIESAGRWLAVYRKDTTLKPEEIGSFSEEAEHVLRLLLKAR